MYREGNQFGWSQVVAYFLLWKMAGDLQCVSLFLKAFFCQFQTNNDHCWSKKTVHTIVSIEGLDLHAHPPGLIRVYAFHTWDQLPNALDYSYHWRLSIQCAYAEAYQNHNLSHITKTGILVTRCYLNTINQNPLWHWLHQKNAINIKTVRGLLKCHRIYFAAL